MVAVVRGGSSVYLAATSVPSRVLTTLDWPLVERMLKVPIGMFARR